MAVGRLDNDVVVVSLHPNGDLDNSLNGTGVFQIPGDALGATITDATLIPNGVIISARQDPTGASFAAKRILLDGTVEDFAPGFPVNAVLADASSSIFTCTGAIRLALLDPTGLMDGRFGDQGLLTIDLPAAFPLYWMRAKAFDDAVYIFGMTRAQGNDDALLYRFLPNGEVDAGFGIGGCVTLSHLVWFLNVNDVARMPDGRLVIGGYGDEANIVRLNQDGRPDTTFGNNGVVEFRGSGRSTCEKIALFENSILVAGNSSDGSSRNDVFVAKLMPDGRPDNRFHGEGFLSLTIKHRDSLVDFAIADKTITLLCQSDCDAPRHFRTGLARMHL